MKSPKSIYVVACGALAREIHTIKQLNKWEHLEVDYLPSGLHHYPQKIPDEVRAKLLEAQRKYDVLFVAYADCGTGGRLDLICEEFGVERLPGAHCYQFFAGNRFFTKLAEQEPGTFYLTDFLAQHFDRLIMRGLGIDQHPELQETYFGNYKKLVYLAQTEEPQYLEKAQVAAKRLGLAFEKQTTGYGELLESFQCLTTQGTLCPN